MSIKIKSVVGIICILWMKNYNNLLISNSSSGEYEITRQLLNTFIQAFVVRYQGEIGAVFSGAPEDYYQSTNIPEHYNWIIYFNSTNESIILN